MEVTRDTMTLEEAAEELSTTGLRLLMVIREGGLAGFEEDGVWHVTRSAVAKLKRCGIAPVSGAGCGGNCAGGACAAH